ncbi:hypothetical protein [uncultured Roseobacter sp.]|uniref:hypothetical protein n=1 Tax=uncultured Roseobacter sp. TaxID=114847 RepID=UPI00260638AE|nr:hypothetical protein [uncultured Roseobacter sp.]
MTDDEWRDRLPLLTDVFDLAIDLEVSLEGWHCIYVQHVLTTNYFASKFLISLGLAKKNLFVIGKDYSTSAQAMSRYHSDEISASSLGSPYDFSCAFDEPIVEFARDMIIDLIEGGANKLLLLDEGGILARAFKNIPERSDLRLVFVELTSRGLQHVNHLSASSVHIDVGHSYGKQKIESLLIADSMQHFIKKTMTLRKKTDLCKVAIVGVGAIGHALSMCLLQSGFHVETYDICNEKGTSTSMEGALDDARIILSCTGRPIDVKRLLMAAPGRALLFNCGSSDVEFSLWRYRESLPKIWSIEASSLLTNKLLHRDISIPSNDGHITICNGGFPINLGSGDDPIPEKQIQITRALMLLGVVQGVSEQQPGKHTLSEKLQHPVISRYRKLLE